MSTWESVDDAGQTRVTLRAERWDRWVDGTVLSLSFLVWSFVELFLANIVLSFTAISWRVPAPGAMAEMIARAVEGERPSIFFIFFVAIFAILWTRAGTVMLTNILRLLFGSDRVVMTREGVHIRRAVGPFGWTRTLRGEEVTAIAIRGRARCLVAQAGAKHLVVASLGTEADRRRLGAELRSRYGLLTPAGRLQGGVPPRWAMTRRADGTVSLQPPREQWRSLAGCATAVAVVWWLLVALRFFMKNLREEPLLPTAGDWVALTIGLLLTSLPFLAARSRETIEVGRNSLVLARVVGPWKTRRDFRNASLQVAFHATRGGTDMFALEVESAGTWSSLASSTNDATDPLALGRFIAAETGWELDVASQAREIGG